MTQIKIENSFADNTTRKMTIGNFEDNSAAVNQTTVKTNISNINLNAADIANLYLSEGGASFTGITYAEIYIETQSEIAI